MALQDLNNLQDNTVTTENDNAFYTTVHNNWFVARPYGFRITFSDNKSYVCFLPISPSNLNITTHFATNIIPTLYGTVEEHSDVRYFDIAIEGTTGMAPKYVGIFKEQVGPPMPGQDATSEIATNIIDKLNLGRQSFSITKSIPLGGFFSKSIGALSSIKNSALDIIDGTQKTNESGIAIEQSGYTAFHTLYKMLLRHKKDAAGVPVASSGIGSIISSFSNTTGIKLERKTHPIIFFNYKDGNQYNVVIRNFTMRRSADNPMLYYYSISMRGYALSGLQGQPNIDNQEQRLKELGLDGVKNSSILGDIKKKSNSAKGILGAAVGGINILGS